MKFALAGNQNCGKTTLFNQLTGSNQHVGNFPGVTVESKVGKIRGTEDEVVDLPGIYSLSPYTQEEIVTRDFLTKEHPDGIINIIDATNIERNFYLTLQLLQLNIPMVVALNMMDEVRSNGGTIKVNLLKEELGVPVVPISASKNEGVDELIETALRVAKKRQKPKRQDFCSGPVHRTLHAVAHLVEDHAENIGIPAPFVASKLVERDQPLLESLNLSDNEIDMIEHSVTEMEKEMETDRKAAIADMRYTFIDKIVKDSVVKPKESLQHSRSVKIDKVLTNKYLAIPLFLVIMFAIFAITFGTIGGWLSDRLSDGIDIVSGIVENALTNWGINPVVRSLVVNGVITGVGSVLSFIPVIVILFFFLSILEDSGYMARVAFVMDKLLRKIGLSGRSFVPMLIGFGCTVPAVMSARTLSSERDRKMTILLTPFMSCSAKLPIYGIFTLTFFPHHRGLVMISLYVIGILVGILCGLIFNQTLFRGKPVPFVMELPNYRLPSAKSVGMLLWNKAKDFVTRAFTIIFLASIIIWFLQTFDIRFNVVADSSDSMLAGIGRLLTPVFEPLGIRDWRMCTSLVAGFTAKEAVVSTAAVLMGTTTTMLPGVLAQVFSQGTAFVFLIFTLLYTPCVAAVSTVSKEMGKKWALFVVIFQIGVAWIVAFAANQLISLFV